LQTGIKLCILYFAASCLSLLPEYQLAHFDPIDKIIKIMLKSLFKDKSLTLLLSMVLL